MAFGIYKQGQGYWVRVMTAAFVGVLIISAAAWAWGQAGIVRLPARTWTLAINSVEGEVSVGDIVELLKYETGSLNDVPVPFGTALVEDYKLGKNSTATLIVGSFSSNEVRDQGVDTAQVLSGTSEAPKLKATVRNAAATPIFPVLYLQSAAAGGVMLLGALLIYIFVGMKKQAVEFLIATDGEMKKVNWTTYREVKGSTIVVIVATFLIAGFLFLVDSGFSQIFQAVGVLES